LPAEATPATLWLPELASPGGEIALGEEDSHYVVRVCRARAGDLVSATDGRGTLAALRVIQAGRTARARVESLEAVPDPGCARVACGAPEGQRADWLVEKLAELGIRVLQPLDTERGAWERFDSRRERLERIAIAALRQSRQAWRMEIAAPRRLRDWLQGTPAGGERWVADPAGGSPARVGAQAEALLVVGPAGGLDAEERAAIGGAGFVPVRLSPSRLRAETAAIAWGSHWAAARASRPLPTNP
jgi:16S rRNA (uracil1498-N3)-methyltransferase